MKEQKKKSYPEKDIDYACDRCRAQVSENEFICPDVVQI